MRKFRPIGLAAFVLAACLGCTSGTGPETSSTPQLTADSVDGLWQWDSGPLDCPSLTGLLQGQATSFFVTQNGEQVGAEFTDSGGNHVVLTGSLVDRAFSARLVVRSSSSTGRRLSHDTPICNGKAYLTSALHNTVYVFNTRLGALLRVIPLPGGPTRPGSDPHGSHLFVPLPERDEVAILETVGDTVFARLADGLDEPRASAVTRDGLTLFVANATGHVTTFDLPSFARIGDIELAGIGTTDLALSRDGTKLFAIHHETAAVDVIDPARGELVATVPTSEGPRSAEIATAPDGQETLLVIGDAGLDVFEVLAAGLGGRTTHALPGFDVAVTPDGRAAYLTRSDTPEFGTVFDLVARVVTASFRTGTSQGYGIDLCREGNVALVGLGSDFPSVVLDLTSNTLFDHLGPTGEFFHALDEPILDERELVVELDGSAREEDGALIVAGQLRITSDSAGLTPPCSGRGQSFQARVSR